MPVKICYTGRLWVLNGKAVRDGEGNRWLSADLINRLDPDGTHVLNGIVGLEDGVRCAVLAKVTGSDQPVAAMLDLSYEDFNALPDAPAAD
jgi:hypothetical protein